MIPFAKPKFADDGKIRQVLKSGQVTNGKYCRLLEEKVKEISGAEYAVATNSCTTGLWLAQRALGFFKKKHGLWEKRIAVPAFTWTSTHWNIRMPVWMDCDVADWNIPDFVFNKANFDGVIVTSVFGRRADVYLEKRNRPIIYDSAHSLGLKMHGLANAEVYSLAPSKTFTGMEGGIIVTNDVKLAENLREDVKWAGRLGEVNAAVALSSLEDWKKKMEQKREIAHYYMSKLPLQFQDCNRRIISKVYETDKIYRTEKSDECLSTHNEVGMVFSNQAIRDYVQRNIKGVETRIRYRPDERCSAKAAPVAWDVYNRSLNIPSWIGVDKKAVVDAVKQASFMEQESQDVMGWFGNEPI